MDEDHFHVVKVFQHIHPYVSLMRVRWYCTQEGHVNVLEEYIASRNVYLFSRTYNKYLKHVT